MDTANFLTTLVNMGYVSNNASLPSTPKPTTSPPPYSSYPSFPFWMGNTDFSFATEGPLDLTVNSKTGLNKPSKLSDHHHHKLPQCTKNGHPAKKKSLHPCETCGRAFDRPSLLLRHRRIHTGEKPFVCDVCQKAFNTNSSLITHKRTHTGERPHQCPVCGARFTASSNLYYHKMTHEKEKPHKCDQCDKSFPTPGDLKRHQHTHSATCRMCHRGFAEQT